MIEASTTAATMGGLGLLLLGMSLMTDGLRTAAGRALHRLLERWTSTRGRGFLAGMVLTAVVQSSSAVTVAVIGFANAGFLTLSQAAWAVFGSNVGTTATAWIVAWLGLRLDVEAFALPLIGAGMLLRIVRPRTRVGSLGEALAGFGTLFLGLGILKAAFGGLGASVDLSGLEGLGPGPGVLAGVLLGAALTAVMQSSSAALAIVLTASEQGILSLSLGAAFVIGANLGTTSTALLATIGATAPAKRTAALHVVFNLVTAGVAALLVQPLLRVLDGALAVVGLPSSPAAELALFHTAFNLLGIVLMLPLAGGLIRFLERRFVSREEDLARPRFLDATVLPVPEVAVDALRRELKSAGALVGGLVLDAVQGSTPAAALDERDAGLRRLLVAVGEFATALGRGHLSDDVSSALSQLHRVHERYLTALRLLSDVRLLRLDAEDAEAPAGPVVGAEFVEALAAAITAADPAADPFDPVRERDARDRLEGARDDERVRILRASQLEGWSARDADQRLLLVGQMRRLANQLGKAAEGLAAVKATLRGAGNPA